MVTRVDTEARQGNVPWLRSWARLGLSLGILPPLAGHWATWLLGQPLGFALTPQILVSKGVSHLPTPQAPPPHPGALTLRGLDQ